MSKRNIWERKRGKEWGQWLCSIVKKEKEKSVQKKIKIKIKESKKCECQLER